MAEPREYLIRSPRPRTVTEAGPGAEIESVSGLTRRIKGVLESAVAPCWVRGEVSNVRAQSSGHVYFSLKDAECQIACVMFRGDALRSGAATSLHDGSQLVVFGEISVYEPRGNYQLIVRVALDDGLGRLQQEFERLKQRLAAEGLFEAARKKPLPTFPTTVGFITSPTGAAVQDFIRILKRRRWRGRLIVLPVKVQGDGAAAEMIAALSLAQRLGGGMQCGLLVIGRGGGSLEDLWAFNDEALVRALAACAIPTIAAIGHEIDFTLCDFAADVRAETPSAAAELISSAQLDVLERLRQAREKFDRAADDALRDRAADLEILRRRLAGVSPVAHVEQMHLRLDDLTNRLRAAARHELQQSRHRLAELAERLARVSPRPAVVRARERLHAVSARLGRELGLLLQSRSQRLARAAERLQAVGPDAVLRRGYVIMRDGERRPVTARSALHSGQRLSAQWHDGEAPLRAE